MDQATADMPTPPGWERKRNAPPRRPLDYGQIVDAAMKILDAEGLTGLSMRRVAQELGTGAASLYAHIQNKEELIDAVLDRVIGEAAVPPADPNDTWRDELTKLAGAVRAALSAHRDIASALWGKIPLGPNAMALSERCFGVLRRIGLPDQIVAWAGPLLFDFITADAYEGSLYADRFDANDSGEYYFGQVRTYFASLPPARFPNVVALATTITSGESDERYNFGLNVLLSGLAAQLPPQSEDLPRL